MTLVRPLRIAARVRTALALVFFVACTIPASAQRASTAVDTCRPDPDGPVVQRSAFPPWIASDYVLPYEAGTARLVWRTTSHFARGNGGVGLYAIDFDMPTGTPVVAVRSGVVVAVQESFPDGNDTDLEENFVMVRHADSSVARYIHLTQNGALVAVGDRVQQSQRIALSGNTGQTGGAHLHFDVQTCGPNLPPGYNTLPCGMTVPVTFSNTEANVCGLVPGQRYVPVARPTK